MLLLFDAKKQTNKKNTPCSLCRFVKLSIIFKQVKEI